MNEQYIPVWRIKHKNNTIFGAVLRKICHHILQLKFLALGRLHDSVHREEKLAPSALEAQCQ